MDNAHLPLISVIMPAHNAERYIAASVESVLQQTYPHWELIIIDDASTDKTSTVVAKYNDPRIRYIRVSRIGSPAGVRNVGLWMAQGELIAFLDADDLYYPKTLETLSKPLLEKPDLTAVYGFSFSIDEHDNALPPSVTLVPIATATKKGEDTSITGTSYKLPPHYNHSWENIVTSNITCLLPALILRRSTLERVGLFNEELCGPEDYEFYVRIYLDNYEGVYCLSDYVYQYRIHSASLTKAPEHYDKLLGSCLKIMEWLFNKADIPPHVKALKSRGYTDCYRYLSRERLLHHQPKLARHIAFSALKNPNINKIDFLKQCGPLIVRSYLPYSLDNILVSLRWTIRNKFFPFFNKPQFQSQQS